MSKMKYCVLIFGFLFSVNSFADLSIDITIGSEHINANSDYTEFNPGVGVRWMQPKEKWSYGVAFGGYRNSIDNTSAYLMGVIQHRLVEKVDVGVQFGLVSGYNTLPADIFGGLVFIERPFGRLLGRVAFIPPFEDNSGVFGFQIGILLDE